MTVTASAARHRTLWLLTLHGAIRPPDPAAGPIWQQELDRLIGEGRARPTPDGRIEALPHPRAPKWTAEAEAAIVQATRLILSTLGATGAPIRACRALAAEWGLSPEAAAEARQRLIADGLVRVTDTNATAAVMTPPPPLSVTPESLGLLRRQRPRPKPAPSQMAPPASAPTAPVPPAAPTPAAKPEPLEPASPVVQPERVPEPELSRPPVRAERPTPTPTPTPKPKSAVPAPGAAAAPALTAEYLARITAATELQARLTAATVRQPAALPAPKLRATLIRICEWLHAADEPLTAGALGTDALNTAQRPYRDVALAEGLALDVLGCTGARTFGRGVRYVVRDPSALDLTWEALDEAAAKIRSDRERRQRQKAG